MQGRDLYEYAIIRLVPKVERGEYINIGIILLSKKSNYLGMRYQLDTDRLKAFSQDIDIELVDKYLSAWRLVCDGGPKGGKIGELEIRLRFRWLTASRSTIIQSSPVHPGFCSDVDATMEKLFTQFVL